MPVVISWSYRTQKARIVRPLVKLARARFPYSFSRVPHFDKLIGVRMHDSNQHWPVYLAYYYQLGPWPLSVRKPFYCSLDFNLKYIFF